MKQVDFKGLPITCEGCPERCLKDIEMWNDTPVVICDEYGIVRLTQEELDKIEKDSQ